MNKLTDLVLVSFLDNHPEGETFLRNLHSGWPLHITLFPWFGVDDFDNLDYANPKYCRGTQAL